MLCTPTRYNLLDIPFLDLAYALYPSITVPCCVRPTGTTYLTVLFLILPIHSILASQYQAVCTPTRYNLLDIPFLDLAYRLYPSITVTGCVCTPTKYNLLDIPFLDLAYALYPSITVPCCVRPPGTTYLTVLFLILPIHSILASQYRAVYPDQVQLTWHSFSWSCLSTLS